MQRSTTSSGSTTSSRSTQLGLTQLSVQRRNDPGQPSLLQHPAAGLEEPRLTQCWCHVADDNRLRDVWPRGISCGPGHRQPAVCAPPRNRDLACAGCDVQELESTGFKSNLKKDMLRGLNSCLNAPGLWNMGEIVTPLWIIQFIPTYDHIFRREVLKEIWFEISFCPSFRLYFLAFFLNM